MSIAFTRIWQGLLALYAFAALGLRGSIARTRYFDPDEFQHLHGAYSIANGLVPFRDYFEHHTPWFHYALCIVPIASGDSIEGIHAARVAMTLLSAVIVFLTYRLGKDLFGKNAGLLGAALLSTNLVFFEKVVELRPDVPALVLWLLALGWLMEGVRERGSNRRIAWAGLALGSAIMLTQKMLFGIAGVGLAIAWLGAAPRGDHAFESRWRGAGVLFAAIAAPVLATTMAFAWSGAGSAFIENNFLLNARWEGGFSAFEVAKRIVFRSPVVFALGLGGWVSSVLRLVRDRERAPEQMILAAATASLVLGAWVIPVPHRQYFLPLLPLWCIYAARLAVNWAESSAASGLAQRWAQPGERRRIAADAIGLAALLLLVAALYPYSLDFLGTAKQLHFELGLVLLFTLPLTWLARPWQRSLGLASALLVAWALTSLQVTGAWFLIGAAGLAFLAWGLPPRLQALAHLFVWIAAVPTTAMIRSLNGPSNAETLAAIERVHENTEPDAEILTGWGLTTPFRPHAYRYFFLHSEMRAMMSERERGSDVVELLEQRRPTLVAYDRGVRALTPEVQATIRRLYEPSALPPFWIRRDRVGVGPGLIEASPSEP